VKADEYRELGSADLGVKLDEAREEYFNLRFQNATGQLENFSQIGRIKRDIARIRTILRERELGLDVEVSEAKPTARSRAKPAEEGSDRKAKRSGKKKDEDSDNG
jgi:large subunit ribosomal protein L29